MRTERQIHGEVSDGSAQCADDDELQDENTSDGDDPGPIIEGAAQYPRHYAPGAEQDGQNRDRPPVARQGDAEHVQIPFFPILALSRVCRTHGGLPMVFLLLFVCDTEPSIAGHE
ncbi:MAG: hypothetical protein ACLRL4_07925 [Bifidobacterium bifidum]|uniref:hypothetical protein n=1 Tax=Bifidobacterium TaxID=1678 RepID=UPI0014950A90|nr:MULTISPECIES: hypothetical protein [Bifidobacterium]MCZ4484983.1 hypothetical protein [Bifidobacterium bifidum]